MLKFKRGDTFSAEWDSGIDLTGCTVACSMKYTMNDGLAVQQQRVDFYCEIIDAAGGIVRIYKDATDTESWLPGVYNSDIEVNKLGVISSTSTFQINVVEDYTNAD